MCQGKKLALDLEIFFSWCFSGLAVCQGPSGQATLTISTEPYKKRNITANILRGAILPIIMKIFISIQCTYGVTLNRLPEVAEVKSSRRFQHLFDVTKFSYMYPPRYMWYSSPLCIITDTLTSPPLIHSVQ